MIPGAIHPMTQEVEDVFGSFAQLPLEERMTNFRDISPSRINARFGISYRSFPGFPGKTLRGRETVLPSGLSG